MISILDYGAGNLRSVQNAFDQIDSSYEVIRDPVSLGKSSRIVLPGVGNFGQMMRALDTLGLRETLRERIMSGLPFLGICLGLQALFERSAEAPDCTGLGILAGDIERFPAEARVPHMGWNDITSVNPSRLIDASDGDRYLYFAHSYFAPVGSETTATCTYGEAFTAVLERDNIFAVQFHPEKSGPAGLALLRRFADLPDGVSST